MNTFFRSVIGLLTLLIPQTLSAGGPAPHETTAADPLSRMQHRLDQGVLRLEFHPRWGYLPSLLRALDIPISSQTAGLFQDQFPVSPHFSTFSPALYFNGDVYVGWVPGGPFLEISAAAPVAARCSSRWNKRTPKIPA